MGSLADEVAQLLAESQELLSVGSSEGPKFEYRHSAMYALMTSQQSHFLFPAVHLWEPDSDTLMAAVVQWEPELANSDSESFYIAVHGHRPVELCGGKAQRIQMCHMAFFKPQGLERESFNKKWNDLYANSNPKDSSPAGGNRHNSVDDSRTGGIQLGSLQGFSF